MGKNMLAVKKDFDVIYWLIGLNAAFALFREAFPILNYFYAFCMVWVCGRTAVKILRGKYGLHVFYLKFCVLLMSVLGSMLFFSDVFTNTIGAVFSMFMIYFVKLGKPLKREWEAFLSGYRLSIGIDFVYAGIQWLFMLRGIQINNDLYMALGLSEHVQQFFSGRVTGLIWDPYVIGMFCATGFFLFQNKWWKSYIVILLILSQSRAGLAAFAAACMYYYYPVLRKRKYFIAALVAAVLCITAVPQVVDITRGFSKDSYGYVRIEYFTLMGKIMTAEKEPFLFLFGGTPVSSLYRFMKAGLSVIVPKIISYSMMESDWCGIVYGQGIAGIAAYLYVFVCVFKKQGNRIYKALAVAVLFGGLGYDYDRAVFANMLVFLPLCECVLNQETYVADMTNSSFYLCRTGDYR